MRLFRNLILLFVVSGIFVHGAEKAKPARLKASSVLALRESIGKEITIYGKVSSTGKSRSGINFLNFYGSKLVIVCRKEDLTKFKAGQPADVFRNKYVEVTGMVELYKGKLQIKLRSPSQIREYDAKDSAATKPKSIELKKAGSGVWLSPVGLKYRGRDPMGLTRIEHVMRHADDIPSRVGSHGVFDSDTEGEIFALIDEAWRLSQKKKLKAEVEGSRSTYLVSMGRRVGYLGGQTGKRKRNPALTRVLIVFETDTKNIITAYPR